METTEVDSNELAEVNSDSASLNSSESELSAWSSIDSESEGEGESLSELDSGSCSEFEDDVELVQLDSQIAADTDVNAAANA